ncbi:hypothetical protein Hanom_Chr09g00759371 [Helianthus anomalus]
MEDDNINDMEDHSFTPTWENGAKSPILENVVGQGSTKYKITCIYDFDNLIEEVATHYFSDMELSFSIFYIDKYATKQSFVSDTELSFSICYINK